MRKLLNMSPVSKESNPHGGMEKFLKDSKGGGPKPVDKQKYLLWSLRFAGKEEGFTLCPAGCGHEFVKPSKERMAEHFDRECSSVIHTCACCKPEIILKSPLFLCNKKLNVYKSLNDQNREMVNGTWEKLRELEEIIAD
jgi:hypothetical protein